MYLFIISIILGVAFLMAVAFQIAYIFIYKKHKKENLLTFNEITTPLEYLYTIVVPLGFIQFSSFVLNNIASNKSSMGNYTLPVVGEIFGSIFNTILLGAVVLLVLFKMVFKKYDRLVFIGAIVVSLACLIVASVFTMLIL
ncbi:hypothetical protein LJC17_04300 [Acholeplasma sp. OttesenSCG-928-E16]|nr:hypothetical protein [Acholeplasma sp. OttesenSCG-928-E16]